MLLAQSEGWAKCEGTPWYRISIEMTASVREVRQPHAQGRNRSRMRIKSNEADYYQRLWSDAALSVPIPLASPTTYARVTIGRLWK